MNSITSRRDIADMPRRESQGNRLNAECSHACQNGSRDIAFSHWPGRQLRVEITVMALGLSSYGGAGLFILVAKTLGLSEQ